MTSKKATERAADMVNMRRDLDSIRARQTEPGSFEDLIKQNVELQAKRAEQMNVRLGALEAKLEELGINPDQVDG